MKEFNSIAEYLIEGKTDDLLVFEGKGIMSGFSNITKHDVYKHTCIRSKYSISIRAYRGRRNLSISNTNFDQKVRVLSKKEFSKLEKIY